MKALSGLLVLGCLFAAASATAGVGTVTHLSGTLSSKGAVGASRVLAVKSEVNEGDLLTTETETYARVKFVDGAEIVLRPGTQLRVAAYSFQESKPQSDSAFFSLLKGGLRAVTGVVGKRNPDAYRLGTATATIGIRGTTFTADDCINSVCPTADGGTAEPGVIVGVQDGEIVASNQAGSQNFLAGQFGMMDSAERRPRFLSTDPGLQFAPPASFIQSISTGSAVNSGRSLECVVRR